MSYKYLDKALLIFKKTSILFENLKTLTSSNCPTVQYFFAETSHMFPTYQCLQKDVWDFFKVLFRSCLFAKLNRPGFHTLVSYDFFNNSRSRRNKKKLEHSFVDIIKQKRCEKFQQKMLNSVVVGTHQNF